MSKLSELGLKSKQGYDALPLWAKSIALGGMAVAGLGLAIVAAAPAIAAVGVVGSLLAGKGFLSSRAYSPAAYTDDSRQRKFDKIIAQKAFILSEGSDGLVLLSVAGYSKSLDTKLALTKEDMGYVARSSDPCPAREELLKKLSTLRVDVPVTIVPELLSRDTKYVLGR